MEASQKAIISDLSSQMLRYLYMSTLDGQRSIIARVNEVKIDVHGGVPDNGVVQYISCDTNPFKSGDTNPMTFSYKHGNALKSDDMIHYIVERDDLSRMTRDLAIIQIMDQLEICTLDSATGKYVVYNKSWAILRVLEVSTIQQSFVCSYTRTTTLSLSACTAH